jgi:phosphoglycerate dehydrogenase-like enzyme
MGDTGGFRLLVTALSPRVTAPEIFEEFARAGIEVILVECPGALSEEQLCGLLPGIDGVWAAPDAYTERALAAADRLKIIARWGVGIETIDLAAATRRGVVVTNTPGATTESVADYSFGLILDLARRLTEMHNALRAGRWERLWGVDVWRKTLGIIGFGHIGQGMARRARGFEMATLAYDPYAPPEAGAELGVERTSLDDLLERSDFVTLHASLTPETRGMIGEAELRRMKPTAFLVNCGRGALVKTDALVRALREGWIAGAAVDVYDVEPAPHDHPLLSLPNCLTLPHSASLTHECARIINRMNADDLLAVARGDRPRFVCNPEVYEAGKA